MNATDQVSRGIEELIEAMDKLNDAAKADLSPVKAALHELGEHVDDEERACAQLVQLAMSIIAVRSRAGAGPLRDLPIPPYHLLLPFKAYRPSASDRSSSSAERPRKNDKVQFALAARDIFKPSVSAKAECREGVAVPNGSTAS